jgi:hypothetical protein
VYLGSQVQSLAAFLLRLCVTCYPIDLFSMQPEATIQGCILRAGNSGVFMMPQSAFGLVFVSAVFLDTHCAVGVPRPRIGGIHLLRHC